MYKYVLENVENIHVFSIASLMIFMFFFTAHVVIALTKSKDEIDSCAAIVMEDGTLDKHED